MLAGAMTIANFDPAVVAGFGDEWTRFDQTSLQDAERQEIFDQYFARFPWSELPAGAVGADIGCGSGRWAQLVAPRVGRLHCIDPSPEALAVARRALAGMSGCTFENAAANTAGVCNLDFAYSLGVLHHAPDTQLALKACAGMLKPGAPFLLYLYYAMDNRPTWFRALHRTSEALRGVVCRLPAPVIALAALALAGAVYAPLALLSRLGERAGLDVAAWPLSFYRNRSFYVMRTDSRDRFGTRLEQRFSKVQIQAMIHRAGFERVTFNDHAPYWVALGYRART